ncbi:hypothetical protein Ciccas_011841, partial [Cichlidogyrus casuarinus]
TVISTEKPVWNVPLKVPARPSPMNLEKSVGPMNNNTLVAYTPNNKASPLSFSLLVTESWAVRFAKGGGASFSIQNSEFLEQHSISGRVVAAVLVKEAREWLERLSRGAVAAPVLFELTDAHRIANVRPVIADLSAS